VKRLIGAIRSRRQKIDPLESAGSLDVLLSRVEMEERLQNAAPSRHLLLIASCLRPAGNRIGTEGGTQLTAAFLKRLHRILPPESAVAPWGEAGSWFFLPAAADSVAPAVKLLAEQLSGSYLCVHAGKSVRPALPMRVPTLEDSAHIRQLTADSKTGTKPGAEPPL